ncbi:PhoU domain-containing protein [Chromatium okenii]|uniref:PhoU domain-containing protein n=1 Tax=Chromatium okenii TaxID=61644 RepID=UPI001F5BB28E|nr:PhoU domain-containing protein [Chromatium okenii]
MKLRRAAVIREAQVDRDEAALVKRVLDQMQIDASFALVGTYLLWIVHNYERVADRATTVAERAIYVAAGHTPNLNLAD